MKGTKNNNIPARSAAPFLLNTKDKRMLVLFLLGLMIITWDVCSMHLTRDQDTIFIDLETQQGDGTLLIAFPSEKTLGSDQADILPASVRQSQLRPLLSAIDAHVCVPAELELFLNRPLHINRADEQTLKMLPGIGPSLARAIDEQRQNLGRFSSAEDLLRVHGIGPARLQQLLPLITFE